MLERPLGEIWGRGPAKDWLAHASPGPVDERPRHPLGPGLALVCLRPDVLVVCALRRVLQEFLHGRRLIRKEVTLGASSDAGCAGAVKVDIPPSMALLVLIRLKPPISGPLQIRRESAARCGDPSMDA